MSLTESIIKWAIVAFIAYGALVSVSSVGKQKKPVTGQIAAAVVLIQAALITAIVVLWD